jgi:hypothetical protein
MAYTDLFNEAIDDLTASLTAVSGLRVVNDATKIVPNCVFIDAPSFTTIAGNGNVIRLEFPIRVIGSGPAGSADFAFRFLTSSQACSAHRSS